MGWGFGFRRDNVRETESEDVLFGLENFGNTCYCNSVLQALYFCRPFRKKILQSKVDDSAGNENGLFGSLLDLFVMISGQKRKLGWISPREFVTRLRFQSGSFRGLGQHDAHEFFNYLINYLDDCLGGKDTWIQDIFQGTLVNQTKCLACQTVTSRTEPFIDLSVDIFPNISLYSALNRFSEKELLDGGNMFYCDSCGAYQQAEKIMKISKLPQILVLHLKRFRYMEHNRDFSKLNHRVPFTTDLSLSTMLQTPSTTRSRYILQAVVIHLGKRPTQGHYVTVSRCGEKWIRFDDDSVDVVEESFLDQVFGNSSSRSMNRGTAYVLFYQSVDS